MGFFYLYSLCLCGGIFSFLPQPTSKNLLFGGIFDPLVIVTSLIHILWAKNTCVTRKINEEWRVICYDRHDAIKVAGRLILCEVTTMINVYSIAYQWLALQKSHYRGHNFLVESIYFPFIARSRREILRSQKDPMSVSTHM